LDSAARHDPAHAAVDTAQIRYREPVCTCETTKRRRKRTDTVSDPDFDLTKQAVLTKKN
jgi:hypothetical protein